MYKVLIAEDQEILRKAYNAKLKIEGFSVFLAEDGQQALDIANKENPDVILLDIMMPNMGGVEFLEKYDVKTKHPNAKVVVFSNLSDATTADSVFALGAKKFLPKATSTPNELIKIINDLINETKSSG